jgi:hypothetical protein
MFNRIKNIFASKSAASAEATRSQEPLFAESTHEVPPQSARSFQMPSRKTLIAVAATAVIGAGVYTLLRHPPLQTVNPGQAALRINQLTGKQIEISEGNTVVIPGLHSLRVVNLRDQSFRAASMSKADGAAPVQSVEGLSLGVDLIVRFAIDPNKVTTVAGRMQSDVGAELVEPALQGVAYKTFARYTVREIFSTKRVEIQQAMEVELKAKLVAEGLMLRSVQVGKVDLPADYSRRMETLLAEELATEKMRYTLELKEKRVKETELEANAEKCAANCRPRQQAMSRSLPPRRKRKP